MSLDDIIKQKRNEEKGRSFQGGNQRFDRTKSITRNRTVPYKVPFGRNKFEKGNPDDIWQHDLFEESDGRGGGGSTMNYGTGTKIKIVGLNYDVMSEDLQEFFSQSGSVKFAEVIYDRTDRSTGTGEVTFTNRADAQKAIKDLDGTKMNGKPIRVFPFNENSLANQRFASGNIIDRDNQRFRNSDNDLVISNSGKSRKVLVGRGERKAPF